MTLILSSQSRFHILGFFLKMSNVLHKTEASNYSTTNLWGFLALQSTGATVWFIMDIFPTITYYPSPPNNELCQADVQKESQHSGEPLLHLMITAPKVRQVATAWDHEFQADISFFFWVEVQT